jgi:hypothetical protein
MAQSSRASAIIDEGTVAADRNIGSTDPMGQVLRATKGRPGRGVARNGLWSALQTHLQGVDGATLPVIPEIEILHVTLLSL